MSVGLPSETSASAGCSCPSDNSPTVSSPVGKLSSDSDDNLSTHEMEDEALEGKFSQCKATNMKCQTS